MCVPSAAAGPRRKHACIYIGRPFPCRVPRPLEGGRVLRARLWSLRLSAGSESRGREAARLGDTVRLVPVRAL